MQERTIARDMKDNDEAPNLRTRAQLPGSA